MSGRRYLPQAIIGVVLVSWLVYLTIRDEAVARVEPAPASAVPAEATALAAIRAELAALADAVAAVSRSVAARGDASTEGGWPAKLNELEDRLAELEAAVGKSGGENHNSAEAAVITDALSQVRSVDEYRPNAAAETAFEIDDGRPLGSYSDAIYESFHEVGDVVQLEDFQCRRSICKITYSDVNGGHDRFSESEDPGTVVLDKLSDKLGGTGLDIRFSRAADGNQVMYVQLR